MRLIRFIFSVAWLSAGCASINQPDRSDHYAVRTKSLFDATTVIQDNWQQLTLRGRTNYQITTGDGGVVIRAEGKNSASGLIRPFNIDTKDCPRFEWRWRVDQLQKSANLNDKKREDVAASIFLLFGDPGFMSSPEPVPTLRYVWTNEQHLKEDVIDNPYLPGVVRSIVIRTGESGRWFTESRDIKKDYENAFGEPPTEWIHAIALFTDNDQTKEPVIAYYKWARVQCTVRVYSPRTRFSVRGSLRFQINIGTLHRRGIPMIVTLPPEFPPI